MYSIIHKLLKIYNNIFNSFTTNIMIFFCKFNKITIGKNAKFYGLTKFSCYKNSKIIIGNNCRFRSKADSNLIGINHKCILSTHNSQAEINIGNNCGFSGTTIGCFKSIIIGNNVKVGANVIITDSDWHPEDKRSGKNSNVVIEDNVWIGVNSIVLKGVRIGANTVIGANSVVTRDIPKNVIAAGNPCKVIKNND